MIASKLLLAAMATVGLAFDVTVWENPDCTGSSRDINVYDNTCSTPNLGFAAVTVNAYGAHRQQAKFHEANNCGDDPFVDFWADGGGTAFVKGKCIPMIDAFSGDQVVANAMASVSS